MAKTVIITEEQLRTIRKRMGGKTFVINEDVMDYLKKTAEMTEYKFMSNIKRFLHDLLVSPNTADVSDSFRLNNISKEELLRKLLSNGIIRREERIEDTDGEGNIVKSHMMIKYVVPKKHFERNLRKLYIKLFEKNLPEQCLTEDGEGGCEAMGATTCDASSGEYTAPVFGLQRRTFANVNEEELDETTTCGGVGSFAYDAPAFGDKESLKRHNGVGGSVSVNVEEFD